MIGWWRRRPRPAAPDEQPPARRPRTVHLQFDMRVINTTLPVEIEGTCNQRPFYYRARSGYWRIDAHVVNCAANQEPYASGDCDIDEQTSLRFAFDRIFEHVMEPELPS